MSPAHLALSFLVTGPFSYPAARCESRKNHALIDQVEEMKLRDRKGFHQQKSDRACRELKASRHKLRE